MTSKIRSATIIASIGAILLAWAPSTAYAGIPIFEGSGIFDIKPGSCPNKVNLNGNGLVPVAILGSDILDVNDINTTAWENNGWRPTIEDIGTAQFGPFVSPLSCNELGSDGFDDLTLKIPRSAFLVELCQFDDENTTVLGTIITLNSGTVFIAGDVVTLLKKNNNDCPKSP